MNWTASELHMHISSSCHEHVFICLQLVICWLKPKEVLVYLSITNKQLIGCRHNLFLHSALVLSRKTPSSVRGIKVKVTSYWLAKYIVHVEGKEKEMVLMCHSTHFCTCMMPSWIKFRTPAGSSSTRAGSRCSWPCWSTSPSSPSPGPSASPTTSRRRTPRSAATSHSTPPPFSSRHGDSYYSPVTTNYS